MPVNCKFLAVFLLADVDNEGYRGINSLVETFEVDIEIGLIDVAVATSDVIDEVSDFHTIETFDWIFEFRIVYLLDCFGSLIYDNTANMYECLPCLLLLFVGSLECFAPRCGSSMRDDGVGGGSSCWRDVWCSVPCNKYCCG